MAARITAYVVAFIVGVTVIAGLIVGAQREDDEAVDLIVVNGRVYQANGTDDLAEAVAVRGNKIVRVGSNRDVWRLRRAQTTVVDAKGGAVLPGFNDAHAHLLGGGLALDQIDLSEATTLEAVKETIRAWADTHSEREWILGRGWYYQTFADAVGTSAGTAGALPTRQLLDSLVPDRPAYLVAYDGHTGWANSKALSLAGITARTPNPPSGVIVRDPRTGAATGVLKETAMSLVASATPQPTKEDKLAAVRAALGHAHRFGVTSVQNAWGGPEELDLYEELRKRGELSLRVYQAFGVGPSLDEAQVARMDQARTRFADDPILKSGAVKIVLDGVIESHTAAMLEPYANRTTKGDTRFTADQLNRVVSVLDKHDWQVFTHAIGDRAVRMALDAYALAAKANPAPAKGRRHRVEHIETIDPLDVRRFGTLGVVASIQPYHGLPSADPPDVWATNIGPERAARGWMSASIAKAGGLLAFGSDWPVMSIDPMLGLHVAVNRTTLEGLPEGGSTPTERLPLRRAVDGYTRNAAWASFDEQRKGSLARDMLADLVVLSQDIFEHPPERLTDAKVVATIFDGKVVYRRDAVETTAQ